MIVCTLLTPCLFTTQSLHPPQPSQISSSQSLLSPPSLSLSAAVALRYICKTNRTDLAAYMGTFGDLHPELDRIPFCLSMNFPFEYSPPRRTRRKSKVLQAIASVIHAMPPRFQRLRLVETVFRGLMITSHKLF